jgi:hypothetical protein
VKRITAATVGFVLHPVGPLPASVYWRRRAVAFAGVVLLLLLIWAILPGGGGDGRRDSAAALGSTSPSPTVPAATPTTPGASGLSGSPATGDPGPAGGGPVAPATTTVTAPPAPPAPPAPAAPTACADEALRLAVSPARPAYVVGQEPVLRLQIRNVGTVGCVRDLGAALQEVLVYRGSQRLWSSNDCYPEGERDVELLRPGVVHTFSVIWSGLSSQPKCAGTRTRVGAGSYTLLGRIGTLVSPRTPMTLRAA